MDLKRLAGYFSPRAVGDLDSFLDDVPALAGTNALIGAGIACLLGAAAVWFASGEVRAVTALRTELVKVEALQPPVPTLKYVAVSQKILKPQLDRIAAGFKGLSATGGADGDVNLSASDTDYFPQFVAAIGALQHGGKNWKVRIKTLCAGRDCKGAKLSATLRIETALFK